MKTRLITISSLFNKYSNKKKFVHIIVLCLFFFLLSNRIDDMLIDNQDVNACNTTIRGRCCHGYEFNQ